MNRQLYRLVFDAARGMRVAVAEHRRSRRKAGQGDTPALLVLAGVLGGTLLDIDPALAQQAGSRPPVVFGSKAAPPAANLPQPYGSTFNAAGAAVNAAPRPFVYDPAKGGASADLAKSGQVSWSIDGNRATFNQGNADRVVINWDSFNIGAGYSVDFLQNPDPTRYVSALNRVWSSDPSLILGSLHANRELILLNANGVYFGRGAIVDTGKFVASSLSLADSVFEKGLRNVIDGSAVFSTAGTDYLPTNLDRAVTVEGGAEIRSAAGGDVLLVAPRVVNQGRIETPSGQTVLAAGDKVYLMSSSDPAQRGLIVAVDPVKAAGTGTPDPTLGVVENGANGSFTTTDGTGALATRLNEIRAESGTVNLVGLVVKQNGVINATTAVKGANGAIYLQAMASTVALNGDPADASGVAPRGLVAEVGSQVRVGAQMGTVEIGAGSVTAVRPSTSSATQLDAEVFNPSRIRVEGAVITVGGGAQVLAPAGLIELVAARDATASGVFLAAPEAQGGAADGSRIVVDPGARISAAGLEGVEVDGSRNQGTQRLFRIELADVPVQRGGALYRNQVFFDVRNADAITAANVSGAAASIARTAEEHSTAGGSVSLLTEGALVLGQDSVLDVSGGSVHYGETRIATSVLLQDGRAITFDKAGGGRTVDALLPAQQLTTAPAYTEGAAGGSLVMSAHQAALDGNVVGRTTRGERQAAGLDTPATPASLTVGLRSDATYTLQALRLVPTQGAPLADSWFETAATSSLAELPLVAELSLRQVADGGFGKLALRAGALTQSGFGALDLGPGGTLGIESSTAQIDGAFRAAGGQLSVLTTLGAASATLGAGDIEVSGRSRFDTAGGWTNLSVGGSASSEGVNGGVVSLTAAHSLTLGAGALLDVSAGAKLAADGKLTQGRAGSIAIGSGAGEDARTWPPSRSGVGALAIDEAVLRGFDFAGGGSLAISAPAVTIGAAPEAGGVAFDPSFFGAGGFGRITLNSAADLRVASGAAITPHLLNWQLADSWRSTSSGSMTDAVARPALLDGALADRLPVSLGLKAFGALTVERGASIVLDPGASLSLASGASVSVGASGPAEARSVLAAPGGSITLSTTGNRGNPAFADNLGLLPEQALWLGSGADLDVSGLALLRTAPAASKPALVTFGSVPDTPAQDRVTGRVLGGGTVTLDAARGYVVAQAGSSMKLDGAVARLNVDGLAEAVTIARPAGMLTVGTPEGFALEGRISAQAPRDAAGHALADGGTLSLSVGRHGVETTTDNTRLGQPYDTSPRTIAVGGDELRLGGVTTSPGVDLTPLLGNGTGWVRSSLLKEGGWSALTLAAGDRVNFSSSLSLNLPLGLVLDTPAIGASPGAKVDLVAASAQIGDAGSSHAGAVPDTSARADLSADASTSLRISAPTIDLYGNLGLQGFSTVALDATREIRFSAAAPTFGRLESLDRQLSFAGALELVAGQVYSTSATQYTVQGLEGSKVTIARPAGATDLPAPLSAYGSVTLKATDIEQGGTLRQPFGRITLAAGGTLKLGEGSVTSVAGDGAAVLFGQTLNLDAWQLPGGDDLFFARADSKSVTLSAPQILTAASASVSAAGGGSLRAWEFFPGVGGSKDYFNTGGLYAVLPDYAQTQTLALDGGIVGAPAYGQQIVVTQGGSGLAPGRYTLLPARFALLGDLLPQGAFLVRRAADQGSSVLRAPLAQDDGSVVVTGYVTQTGSATIGAPGERFVVESSATFGAKSDIRQSDVSALLATRAAAGLAVPPLPRDAGALTIQTSGSSSTTRWQAQIDLGGAGGKPGTLDISAPSVALVDDLARAGDGSLAIAAGTLQASGAGSVLLGGTRSAAANATDACAPVCIDASRTRNVSIDLGAQTLQLEELLAAASERVDVAAGTRLEATDGSSLGAHAYAMNGDGALLSVSANALTVARSGTTPGNGALLSLGAGSRLAGAAVGLDSSGRLAIDPGASLAGTALAIGAGHLVVGAAAATDAPASTLQGSVLDTVRAAPDLSLRAYESIDFAGDQRWAGRAGGAEGGALAAPAAVKQRLQLDAPVLRGVQGADGQAAQVDIAAQDLTLRNTSGRDPAEVAASTGAGTLLLQALPPLRYGLTGGITLGPGAQDIGFDQAALHSGGDIVLAGRGSTRAQSGLLLSAARLTATGGAEQSVTALGALQIATEADSRTLGEALGYGATLALTGATLNDSGLIDLPGGQLTLHASGGNTGDANLRLAAGSLASVAGFQFVGADGSRADGAAGSIDLRADSGRIAWLGTLDVRAARNADGTPAGGDAGSVALHATGEGGALDLSQTAPDGGTRRGTLQAAGGGGVGDRGGRLAIDVRQMASADEAVRVAQTGAADELFALRVREGDLAISAGLQARQITLSADAGTLAIGPGTVLDARSARGGQVQLAAGADLVLGAGARIDARATTAEGRGGDVLLASSDGRIRLDPSALLDAGDGAGAGGRIVLRARRGDDNQSVAIDPLVADHLRAAEVALEAVRVYDGVDSIAPGTSADTTLGQATVAQDNTRFMQQVARVNAALGLSAADAVRVQLRPGVEVRSEGDLSVDGDWNLAANRPGGVAGFLTLRAAGDLWINASISDGFASAALAAPLVTDRLSWSLRLAAGADLGAALPTLTVGDGSASLGGAGDLTIAAGARVRTGSGHIDLAAGRDLVFAAGDDSNAAGQAYVAGRQLTAAEAPAATLFQAMQAKPVFTTGGGDLSVEAGRDIVAPEATQLINNWYWRAGVLDGSGSQYLANAQLAWWNQFSRFGQTLGNFGGGDILVESGRDILNLQAFAPTAGWADSRNAQVALLHATGGGALDVRAGRDLLGGQFMIGRDAGHLAAGGTVGAAPDNANINSPVLALNDGVWRVQGRAGVTVAAPFDPTAAPASVADNRRGLSGYFYTWSADAALRAVSNAGPVVLEATPGEGQAGSSGLSVLQVADLNALMVTVPSLQVAAAGAVEVRGTPVMFPSVRGQLSIWSGDSVKLINAQLAMADSDPALWGNARSPGVPESNAAGATFVPGTLSDSLTLAGLHRGDATPVEVHAERDLNIVGASGGAATLILAKAANLSAGVDAVELSTRIEQLAASDLSTISVGRNLLSGSNGGIEVAGPGRLEITAGRNIDLGASRGVVTTGSARSPALPAEGAAVRVEAAAQGTLSTDVLQARYLAPLTEGGSARSDQYRDALLAFVRDALRAPGLSFAEAWSLFKTFPAAQQARFGQQVLASEFSAVYLTGGVPTEASLADALRAAFERDKAVLLAAGESALAANQALVLPGRESVSGAALRGYLDQLRGLAFSGLDLSTVLSPRVAQLQAIAAGWRQQVAAALGASVADLDALLATNPADPLAQQYRDGLADTTSRRFIDFRQRVLASELADTGALASLFGRKSLPMRLALFEQGFLAAELAGVGSAGPFPVWNLDAPLLAREGALDMTQSSVVTQRGGAISLLNPGGAINVGLKDNQRAGVNAAKGVIALGGGDVLGYAKGDFQVNTQRVFIVGQGDMTVWSSSGDIDSGRGANTAVAAPPLQAQRTLDGVQFVVPATTTGSGLGILADASGRLSGTIGLYPAFGEILALDAFIRAPALVLGSTVKGADNLIASSVGGAAAPVAAPTLNVGAPSNSAASNRVADSQGGDKSGGQQRPGSSLLTVDLLGLGQAEGEVCSEQDERERKCQRPAPACSDAQRDQGQCR